MKTAMQELMDLLETQRRLFVEAERHTLADGIGRTILLSKQFLEKEKEQIIEAGNACGLKAIVYHQKLSEMSKDELISEMVEDGMSHGEEYYNQTYKQTNGIVVDAIKSQVTTTGVWSPKTN